MGQEIDALKVLVVEDNLQARTMIRMMCKELGISQVFTANDGKEALDFLGSCDDLVNIIICDWKMPRMTGIELLQQVRTVDLDVPFLMLTGLANVDSVVAARESGVSGYLRKPFSAEQLEQKIRTLAASMAAA